MKLKFIILLILSISLSNCTIHKKKYSRGFTIEKNNSFSTTSKKKKESFIYLQNDTKIDEVSSLDSTFIITHEQNTSKIIEKKKKSKTSELYQKEIKKELNHSIQYLVQTKALRKFKNIIPPVSEKEEQKEKKNNVFGALGLSFLIFSIAIIPLTLVLGLSFEFIIVSILLSLILLYIFTLISFKKMKENKLRNEDISIINFVMISILYAGFATIFLVALILLIADSSIILSLLALAIGIVSILIYSALVRAYNRYRKSRK